MQDNRYSFISKPEEVNLLRVLREAPKGTPFILVEEKTRHNKPVDWFLFVHKSVLTEDSVQSMPLGSKKVQPDWGFDGLLDNSNGSIRHVKLHSYRAVSGNGRFPGVVKQQIQKLRSRVTPSPKNRKTEVIYL